MQTSTTNAQKADEVGSSGCDKSGATSTYSSLPALHMTRPKSGQEIDFNASGARSIGAEETKQAKKIVSSGKLFSWLRSYVCLPSKWIFTPSALLFIAYIVWLSRFDIGTLWEASDGTSLAIACMLLGTAHFFSPLASRKILQSLGVRVDYRVLLRTHMRRLPARYLPGGVWHTVGRAVDLHQHGVPRAAIAWLVALENGLAIGMAFLFGGALLLFSGAQAIPYGGMVALAVASSFVMLVTLPLFISRFWPDAAPNMSVATWTTSCGWFAVIWAFHAAAFVAYSIALVGGNTTSHALHTGGVYLFSWAIGLVAFFAPQGIGVFEVTAATLSGQALLPANIALVAGFRLCVLVADLCLGLGGRFQRQK